MVKEKIGIEIDIKKKMLTLFILLFPSVIIALIPCGVGFWGSLGPLAIKILIVFYQFIVIKNFIDKFYD